MTTTNVHHDLALSTIRDLHAKDPGGAPWDETTVTLMALGLDQDDAERALNELIDQGLVWEPVLGMLKPFDPPQSGQDQTAGQGD